jgi:hypothetical protein
MDKCWNLGLMRMAAICGNHHVHFPAGLAPPCDETRYNGPGYQAYIRRILRTGVFQISGPRNKRMPQRTSCEKSKLNWIFTGNEDLGPASLDATRKWCYVVGSCSFEFACCQLPVLSMTHISPSCGPFQIKIRPN